jgi:hypothetical protein
MHQSKQAVVLQEAQMKSKYSKMVEDRIVLCKGTFRSNCRGTALYIVGEIDNDEYVPQYITKQIEKLKEVTVPVKHCLAVWICYPERQYDYVYHMGVVVSTVPLLVTHREGFHAKFIENQPIKDAIPMLYDNVIKFYLPQGIERADCTDKGIGHKTIKKIERIDFNHG